MDTNFKTLYQEAHGFLIKNTEEGFMEKQLVCSEYSIPETLKDVYRCLLDALIFTRRMKDMIGPVEVLSQFVFDFDPLKTYSHYGNSWEKINEKMNPQLGPFGSSEKDKNEVYYELFCRGALSGASFLNQLGSMKTFKAFIKSFQNNDKATTVLPLLLQKVVHGFGFPMACTFLSSVGYSEYISPASKVKALLKDIGITESMDNYEALKALTIIARINQKPTNHIHKMFLLIGNGTLSEDGNKGQRYRKEFIGHIIPILNGSNTSQQTQT
jgi:hypothetical protein